MAQEPQKPRQQEGSDHLIQEIDEELRQEKLFQFWQRNKTAIIVLAVLLVVGTAGYTSWQSHRFQSLAQATMGLVTIGSKQGSDWQATAGQLQAFAKEQGGATQGTLARLQAATLYLDNGKKAEAIKIYDEMAQDNNVDKQFQQFATLLSVRAQLDEGDPVALQKQLEPLMQSSAWRYSAAETMGMLALREGDKSKARAIFAQLRDDPAAPLSVRGRATDLARSIPE